MNISSSPLAASAHSHAEAANRHEMHARPRSRSWPGSRDVGQVPLASVNTQVGTAEQESAVHQEIPSIRGRRCLLPTGVQLREKLRKQIASELKRSKNCEVFSTLHGYREKSVKVRFTAQVESKLRQGGLAHELNNSIVRTLRVKNTPASHPSDEFFFFVESVKVNNFLKELLNSPMLSKDVFEISMPSHGTHFRQRHSWERVYAITHTVPAPLVDSRYLYIIPRTPPEYGDLLPIAFVDKEKYLSKRMAVHFSDTIRVISAMVNDKDADDGQKVAKLTALLSPNTLSGAPDNTLPKNRQAVLTAGTFLNRIRGTTDGDAGE
ncbi:hypothetical protein [Endozoicomonas sp. ONNA2]|uniref:hypothetical protein n=1 Tax=Endozoicomonas sp. ONNA2 TaxID=2828741 RepID=UPI00214966C4|nr:hypothetical protein [Endozoicomonas sp. ONNA2]